MNNNDLIEALKDYHELICEKFREFVVGECRDSALCPKCQSNGCINLKIRNAEKALHKWANK